MIERNRRQGKPRLGLINYINCLPIVWPILNQIIKLNAQIILAEPAALNSLFAANNLEYGAMSAFAYLEQREYLGLIPTVSISSNKTVNSVLFFCKKPLDKNLSLPLKIVVPSGSATSINAMLLMLADFSEIKPTLSVVDKPDLDLAASNTDGALIIGDWALIKDYEWSTKYYRYDLAQWWCQNFDLPMVFGVFAIRNSWLSEYQGESDKSLVIKQIGEDLARAARLGLNDCFKSVLNEAESRTGLKRTKLEQYYLSDLDFYWSDKHAEAIDKYEALCLAKGILKDKKVLA